MSETPDVHKISEALLLIANASLEMIAKAFAQRISHINNLIKTDNLMALKKRHPILTDDFREYTALTTSINIMATNVALSVRCQT